ncbi:hypothetical protein STEG23_013679, partial [Scotinomys teguina]
MSAVMLLPGTNSSLLLVQRTVTRTIVLQETISKEKNICGSKRQTTEEKKEKRKKKCLLRTRTTTKHDFEIFKRMTGSLNDDSTWTKTVLNVSSMITNEERTTVNSTSQGFRVSIHSMGKLWISALTNGDLRSNTEPYGMPSFK